MAEEEDRREDTENGGTPEEETAGGAEGEASGKPAGDSKKKLILILVPVVLVVLLVAGLVFSGLLTSLFSSAPKEETTETADGETPAAAAAGGAGTAMEAMPVAVFYDMPDILVNLNSGTKKQVYLKVSVSLDLPDAETSARIEKVVPRIVDSFQNYLRELKVEEIQGSSGLYRLKEELADRINRIISPAKINDVLFKEMLIQ